jgi:hypothetical protein
VTTDPSLSRLKSVTDEEAEEALRALAPRLIVTRASEVVLRRVAYLWDQRIPLGAFTLMPGEEGIGKTTVGVRLMADLTQGKLEGEFLGVPRNVMMISPEDGIRDVMAPRFQVAGAAMDRVLIAQGVFHPVSGETDYGVVLPTDLEALSATVRDQEIAMVWIDSLVTTLPDAMKTISYHDVSGALRRLNGFAEREGVAVVAPWHLNKSGGHESASRMMDSRAFRAATRSVLMVVPVESSVGATEGVVALDKANAGPTRVPALRYRLSSGRYQVEEDGDVVEANCSVAEWLGPEDADGRDIIRAAFAPPGRGQPTPAGSWLEEYLEPHGEVERQVIIEAASAVGFSESSIDRAARAMKVIRRPESGRDEKSGHPWRKSYWSLPVESLGDYAPQH